MNQSQAQRKPAVNDALNLLMEDHENVKSMFFDFNNLQKNDEDKKWLLVQQICQEIVIHSQLEEELFYPEVRQAIDDDMLIDEAEADHAEIKDVISELEIMDGTDVNYERKVNRLADMVNEHVKEEEEEMFPKVREANLDTYALGKMMLAYKKDLIAETESNRMDIKETVDRE